MLFYRAYERTLSFISELVAKEVSDLKNENEINEVLKNERDDGRWLR